MMNDSQSGIVQETPVEASLPAIVQETPLEASPPATVEEVETSPPALVHGAPLSKWPTDLYVPPDALQVFLESFEGPLDLLLYLIQRHNLDILNIPIAEITQQYLHYIELMKELQLDLAAEYLVMAALLMEIKSRLLLPTTDKENETENDPRSKLVQQLREYAQYKQAAEDLDALPRIAREIFIASVERPKIPKEIIIPNISWTALLVAMRDVMERATLFTSHQVMSEPLSVRERMSLILEKLKTASRLDFVDFFTLEEGRAGVVVTVLALLELTKESLIQIVQEKPYEMIEVVSL
ncbi:MAG: segregation/condensation protein A [Candidatus Parabeggiatoa sp.]|nr:segregation/condensation protein A [Candidatus Parabeggiatoa sp.]